MPKDRDDLLKAASQEPSCSRSEVLGENGRERQEVRQLQRGSDVTYQHTTVRIAKTRSSVPSWKATFNRAFRSRLAGVKLVHLFRELAVADVVSLTASLRTAVMRSTSSSSSTEAWCWKCGAWGSQAVLDGTVKEVLVGVRKGLTPKSEAKWLLEEQ